LDVIYWRFSTNAADLDLAVADSAQRGFGFESSAGDIENESRGDMPHHRCSDDGQVCMKCTRCSKHQCARRGKVPSPRHNMLDSPFLKVYYQVDPWLAIKVQRCYAASLRRETFAKTTIACPAATVRRGTRQLTLHRLWP
jgi:hypothetical protein